jgi:hypothetical protein
LHDATYRELQTFLMASPMAGAVIKGTGGLRKVRVADPRRNKGTRGGVRVIYYYWDVDEQIWLFTVYEKHEADDLSPTQARMLKARLDEHIKLARVAWASGIFSMN